MKTPELIKKCVAALNTASRIHEAGCDDAARRELRELQRLLTKELREPKKT